MTRAARSLPLPLGHAALEGDHQRLALACEHVSLEDFFHEHHAPAVGRHRVQVGLKHRRLDAPVAEQHRADAAVGDVDDLVLALHVGCPVLRWMFPVCGDQAS
jgi:hypothetical protein